MQNSTGLQQEWCVLQNQFDSYEKCSLLIKLIAVVLMCLLIFSMHIGLWGILIAAVLWLQDAIWKTFQSRISERLLSVEQALAEGEEGIDGEELLAMQFNQAWLAKRQGTTDLITEYVQQALKPTVAYPHIVLILVCLAHCLLS
jgi:hypothetical protein